MQNSYLKCNSVTKDKFTCVESCVYENAFEENYNFSDFISFNVSDDKSYNAVLDYLSNHSVSSLFINFTGDYDFVVQPPFDRSMSVIFKNNGFDVRFKDRDGGDKLEITRSISLHFIDFVIVFESHIETVALSHLCFSFCVNYVRDKPMPLKL